MHVFYLLWALYLQLMKKSKYIPNREQDISDIRHYELLVSSFRRSYCIFMCAHNTVTDVSTSRHQTKKKKKLLIKLVGHKSFAVDFFFRFSIMITFQKSQCRIIECVMISFRTDKFLKIHNRSHFTRTHIHTRAHID